MPEKISFQNKEKNIKKILFFFFFALVLVQPNLFFAHFSNEDTTQSEQNNSIKESQEIITNQQKVLVDLLDDPETINLLLNGDFASLITKLPSLTSLLTRLNIENIETVENPYQLLGLPLDTYFEIEVENEEIIEPFQLESSFAITNPNVSIRWDSDEKKWIYPSNYSSEAFAELVQHQNSEISFYLSFQSVTIDNQLLIGLGIETYNSLFNAHSLSQNVHAQAPWEQPLSLEQITEINNQMNNADNLEIQPVAENPLILDISWEINQNGLLVDLNLSLQRNLLIIFPTEDFWAQERLIIAENFNLQSPDHIARLRNDLSQLAVVDPRGQLHISLYEDFNNGTSMQTIQILVPMLATDNHFYNVFSSQELVHEQNLQDNRITQILEHAYSESLNKH